MSSRFFFKIAGVNRGGAWYEGRLHRGFCGILRRFTRSTVTDDMNDLRVTCGTIGECIKA